MIGYLLCTAGIAAGILLSCPSCPAAAHENVPVCIMERSACITGEGVQNVALYGVYPNKGLYATQLTIRISDKASGEEIGTIAPEQNAGYLPAILTADFTGDGVDEIYLGIDSGGSGGFGYAYVYGWQSGAAQTLFDFAKVPMPYLAQYEDGFRMSAQTPDGTVTWDISARGEEYLASLYRADGALLAPTQADISAVNTVQPFFASIENRFHLLVMRRITGLYNADSFGYTLDWMRWNGTEFTTYFRLIGISPDTPPAAAP